MEKDPAALANGHVINDPSVEQSIPLVVLNLAFPEATLIELNREQEVNIAAASVHI